MTSEQFMYGVTITSLIFGIVMTWLKFRKSDKKDIENEASNMTTVMIKLETINNNLLELKSEFRKLQDESRDNHDRIIRIESHCPYCTEKNQHIQNNP